VFSHVVGTLGRPGDLPPVPDLEDAGTLNPAQLSRWTHAWLERAARLTGRDAIVYTNVSFWRQSMANSPEFAMYPLWLADYGVRQPARVGGWKRCVFWQNTETGRMAGAGLNDTMLARQPAGSTRNDATHSRSDLRSWLRAFGMDRSGAIPGH
jgi:GH25 family lysozyme M1 (1,4-beta-N-acetylmuramidase)